MPPDVTADDLVTAADLVESLEGCTYAERVALVAAALAQARRADARRVTAQALRAAVSDVHMPYGTRMDLLERAAALEAAS